MWPGHRANKGACRYGGCSSSMSADLMCNIDGCSAAVLQLHTYGASSLGTAVPPHLCSVWEQPKQLVAAFDGCV